MEIPSRLGATIAVSPEDISRSYVEIWRLEKIANVISERTTGNALRRIAKHLKSSICGGGFELIDFEGRPYDVGMAPEVIDVLLVKGDNAAEDIVCETVEPTITYEGRVLVRGQIVLRRSRPMDEENVGAVT